MRTYEHWINSQVVNTFAVASGEIREKVVTPPPPPPPVETGDWTVEFYGNVNLSGSPIKTITAKTLAFNWGEGSPAAGVPVDNWSARFKRTIKQGAAPKRKFIVTADDGFQLWINGEKAYDAWREQAPTTYDIYAKMNPNALNTVEFRYYEARGGAVFKESNEEYTPPPAPIVRTAVIGINNVAPGNGLREMMELGCPFGTTTFNPRFAWELKQQYPNAMIGARANLPAGYRPTHQQWRDLLHEAFCENMILFGVNEGDHGFDSTPDSILARGEFDMINLEFCQRNNMIYVGAGYSMGNPNWRNPKVPTAVHRAYAEFWAKGGWWNQHCYSGDSHGGLDVFDRPFSDTRYELDFVDWEGKPVHLVERDLIWLEQNWRFLFYLAGLDPTCPNGARVCGDETGFDWEGHGGFIGSGCTDEYVFAWCKRFIQVQSENIIINGAAYPSPFIGAAIFQIGDMNRWAGYDVTRYAKRFKEAGVWS